LPISPAVEVLLVAALVALRVKASMPELVAVHKWLDN